MERSPYIEPGRVAVTDDDLAACIQAVRKNAYMAFVEARAQLEAFRTYEQLTPGHTAHHLAAVRERAAWKAITNASALATTLKILQRLHRRAMQAQHGCER